MNTLNRGTERRAWPLTKLNVPVKIIGKSRPPPPPGLSMLWLWIETKQYELDSRGTTPLNSNAKKRKGKTLASFWQRRFPFWRKIKPLIPVLLTTYFSPAMKTVYFLTFKTFWLPAFLSHCIYSHVCCCFSCLRYVFESRTLMMHEILVFGHWKPVNNLNNEAVLESTLLFFPAPVFNFYAQAFVF